MAYDELNRMLIHKIDEGDKTALEEFFVANKQMVLKLSHAVKGPYEFKEVVSTLTVSMCETLTAGDGHFYWDKSPNYFWTLILNNTKRMLFAQYGDHLSYDCYKRKVRQGEAIPKNVSFIDNTEAYFDAEMFDSAEDILVKKNIIADLKKRLSGLPSHLRNAILCSLSNYPEEVSRTTYFRRKRDALSILRRGLEIDGYSKEDVVDIFTNN